MYIAPMLVIIAFTFLLIILTEFNIRKLNAISKSFYIDSYKRRIAFALDDFCLSICLVHYGEFKTSAYLIH